MRLSVLSRAISSWRSVATADGAFQRASKSQCHRQRVVGATIGAMPQVFGAHSQRADTFLGPRNKALQHGLVATSEATVTATSIGVLAASHVISASTVVVATAPAIAATAVTTTLAVAVCR